MAAIISACDGGDDVLGLRVADDEGAVVATDYDSAFGLGLGHRMRVV
jgi:hypothetical protein